MATQYKAPGIAVHQTIQPNSQVGIPDQNVALVGPNVSLRLYNTIAAEREKSRALDAAGNSVFYVAGKTSTCYLSKFESIGDNVVAEDFTKVYLRNALVNYWESNAAASQPKRIPGKHNQLAFDSSKIDLDKVRSGDVILCKYDTNKVFERVIHAVNATTSITEVATSANLTANSLNSAGAPTPIIGGVFDADDALTYIITVKKGGNLTATSASSAIVRVTSLEGSDTVIEKVFTYDDLGTECQLGTHGLTFSFPKAATVFEEGDKWTYEVKATASSQSTFVLQTNLPPDFMSLADADAEILETKLCLKDNFQLAKENYTYDSATKTVTINAAISTTVVGIHGIVDQSCIIEKADPYVECKFYNDGMHINIGAGVINNMAELERVFSTGALHPENTLKYGIYKALQNSGGTPVIYAIVKDPTNRDSWQSAFNVLGKNRNAYEIVPLTDDDEIKRLCVNFVLSESTDEINRRKEAWLYQSAAVEIPVIGYSDESKALAKVVEGAGTPGVFSEVEIPSEYLTVDFAIAEVIAGDQFRFNYGKDANGNDVFDTRTVRRVISNSRLELTTPITKPLSVAQRYEIWRSVSSANLSDQITKLNRYNHRRVIVVNPWTMSADGYANIPGYFGAAMVAALTASLPPNDASTLKTITGLDTISGFDEYSEQLLNDLAVTGVTMLSKDEDGVIFIRHTLTTGDFNTLNEREEMTTRNFDNISNYYTAALMSLRGNISATDEGLTAVYDTLMKTGDKLLLRHRTGGKSGQLVNYEIVSISIDPIFQDVINAHINLELPHMANRIELYLNVVATTSAMDTVLSGPVTSLTTSI